MNISRRDFFIKSVKGAALVSLPVLIPGLIESCKDNSSSPSVTPSYMTTIEGTFANGKVTVNIDSNSVLSKVGNAAIVSYTSGSIMIDHPSADVYNAFSRSCTHQGCLIEDFDTSSKQFFCGCHGSRFSENGNVSQGPANAPLKSYPAQFSNNVLTITIS